MTKNKFMALFFHNRGSTVIKIMFPFSIHLFDATCMGFFSEILRPGEEI